MISFHLRSRQLDQGLMLKPLFGGRYLVQILAKLNEYNLEDGRTIIQWVQNDKFQIRLYSD